ncbi:MAG: NAD(P)-dependent oxidoreductase, partial [Betaproteobacteria bacterium]
MKFLLDFFPIALFFAAYKLRDIYFATGVLMAATLVDLAADGVIDLKQNADGSWTVHRVDRAPRDVTDYEMTMLTALLGYESNECVLDSRSTELGKVLPTFVRQVDEHLHQLGLFTAGKKGFGTSRGATILKWVLGGVAVLAAVAIGYGGVGEVSQTAGVLVAAGLVMAGVVLAAVLYDRRRVKAYTPLGSGAARRAAGFDMNVIYHNRTRLDPALEQAAGARYVSFHELLAESDFLSLNLPYAPENHHLIGAAELARMKHSAIIVNVARGGIIDDGALIEALRDRRIAGAGLDVYEGEPDFHRGFLELDNVALAPHL